MELTAAAEQRLGQIGILTRKDYSALLKDS